MKEPENENNISNIKKLRNNVSNEENSFNNDVFLDDEYVYNPNQKSDEINLLDDEFYFEDETPSFGTEDLYSKYFSKILNVRIGGFKILPLIGAILGIIIIICGFLLMGNSSQRVIDSVASGEYSVFVFIIIFVGLLILIISVMKLLNIENPLSGYGDIIDNIEKEDIQTKTNFNPPIDTSEETQRPPSETTLNEFLGFEEFDKKKIKKRLKKPTFKITQTTLDDEIPNAKKTIPEEEMDKEYEKAKLDTESIEDIFSDFKE